MSVEQVPSAPEPEGFSEAALLLEVEDLHTSFRVPNGVVHAVDGISLTLGRGRTLGIVGESGSGKSVLARSIMGLLPPNAVRRGVVRFGGVEMGEPDSRAARSFWGTQMAMVFQDPMTALNPVMKIGNQIAEPLRFHLGLDRTAARESALSLLKSVGISEPDRRLRQYPHELSGGMRQRVMIAIALSCGPKLLLADEPTTALDVTVQAQILDLLAEQQRERFMAMMLVTHDLGVVAGRTNEIIVMYAGRVVERATTRELFQRARHPYTEALLRSIPRLENPSHTRLEAISGRPPDLLNPPDACRFADRCPYVQDKCRATEPPLIDDGNGHLYRCWFPVEVAASDVIEDVATGAPSQSPPPRPELGGDGGVPSPQATPAAAAGSTATGATAADTMPDDTMPDDTMPAGPPPSASEGVEVASERDADAAERIAEGDTAEGDTAEGVNDGGVTERAEEPAESKRSRRLVVRPRRSQLQARRRGGSGGQTDKES